MASRATTRRSLHGVAELLLAGPQYRRSETIRLRASPGGFATTNAPHIAINGGELVVGGARMPIRGRSCAQLAAATGIDAGPPEGLYSGGSGVNAEEQLDLDPAAGEDVARAFALGDAALRQFAPDQTPVLWPEHFDLGISVDEVNYGVSPGDDHLDEPYAYVGPWRPRQGPFWNAPFGAARPLRELPDASAVDAFFAEGRDLAAQA